MRRRLKMAARKAIIGIEKNLKENLNMQSLRNLKFITRIIKIL